MTTAWRLASGRYPALAGDGARLVGGRWNSPGLTLVYASESLALCLAECLVHLPGRLPSDYTAFRIELPDESIERIDSSALKSDWALDIGYTRAIGDQWIQQSRTLTLAVPSVVLADSTNLLINPSHRDATQLRIVDQRPFAFDPRLRP